MAFIAQRPLLDRFCRACAVLLVVFAMFTLCGMYMRYRQRGVQAELDRLAGALGLAVGTVFLAVWAADDPWRAEPVPLIVFGMTMAIAYRPELALLFTGVVSWIVVLAMGGDLPMFLLLVRHDGRRGAEPGPHPQPQQAGLRRPLRRLRGCLVGPGHEHDRQSAPGSGRSSARPAINSYGPRWPGSS